jgi:hypothetical protein
MTSFVLTSRFRLTAEQGRRLREMPGLLDVAIVIDERKGEPRMFVRPDGSATWGDGREVVPDADGWVRIPLVRS